MKVPAIAGELVGHRRASGTPESDHDDPDRNKSRPSFQCLSLSVSFAQREFGFCSGRGIAQIILETACTVRVRFADLRSVTRSLSLPAPISATAILPVREGTTIRSVEIDSELFSNDAHTWPPKDSRQLSKRWQHTIWRKSSGNLQTHSRRAAGGLQAWTSRLPLSTQQSRAAVSHPRRAASPPTHGRASAFCPRGRAGA
jgi:hypothetical protein